MLTASCMVTVIPAQAGIQSRFDPGNASGSSPGDDAGVTLALDVDRLPVLHPQRLRSSPDPSAHTR